MRDETLDNVVDFDEPRQRPLGSKSRRDIPPPKDRPAGNGSGGTYNSAGGDTIDAGWKRFVDGLPPGSNPDLFYNDFMQAVRDAAKPKPTKFTSFSIDTITGPDLKASFLIYGLLDGDGGLHTVYGPPGAKKTFVMLHASLHISTGREYCPGHPTRRCLVIYIIGEGAKAFRNRALAAMRELDIKPGEAAFEVMPVMPDLARGVADTAALAQYIDELIAAKPAYKGLPILFVVDTLSRAMHGAREDEEGFGTVISNVRDLAQRYKGTTVLVHHCGKDASKKERGWSGLGGNTDGKWLIEDGAITAEKVRDGQDGLSWTFEVNKVHLGVDEDYGKPVTTLTIKLTSTPQAGNREKVGGKRPTNETVFDEAFNEVVHRHGFYYEVDGDRKVSVKAVALAHVKTEFNRRYATGEGGPRTRQAVYRAFSRLLEKLPTKYRTRVLPVESDEDRCQYRAKDIDIAPKAKSKKGEEEEAGLEVIWNCKQHPEVTFKLGN